MYFSNSYFPIFYFSNGAWRQVGQGISAVADNSVLYHGRALVIRNNDTVAKNALFFGEVIDAPTNEVIEKSSVRDNVYNQLSNESKEVFEHLEIFLDTK